MYAAHVGCALQFQHFYGMYLTPAIILDATGDARFKYEVAAHCGQHVSERYAKLHIAVCNERLRQK